MLLAPSPSPHQAAGSDIAVLMARVHHTTVIMSTERRRAVQVSAGLPCQVQAWRWHGRQQAGACRLCLHARTTFAHRFSARS